MTFLAERLCNEEFRVSCPCGFHREAVPASLTPELERPLLQAGVKKLGR
jgi:hypothetical protein